MFLRRLFDGFTVATAPKTPEPPLVRVSYPRFFMLQSVVTIMALSVLMVALKALARIAVGPRPR